MITSPPGNFGQQSTSGETRGAACFEEETFILFGKQNRQEERKTKRTTKKQNKTQHHKYPKPKQPTQKLRKSQTRGRKHFGSLLCQPLLKKICATISTANIKPELISIPIFWGGGTWAQILVLAIGALLHRPFLHLTTRNSIQKHPDHTVQV